MLNLIEIGLLVLTVIAWGAALWSGYKHNQHKRQHPNQE